ncbi:MAK10-like protein [Tanacetum coccineum]
MGDVNPIRTLGDYTKPSHEGYGNTIELPIGNNVVPLRFETIWLVQNGYSFHGLWSKDPNQHLKDFLKLVDLLDLDGENKERTHLCLFQFSLRNESSNGLERLLVGSITTWEDLTTRFLAKFFPSRRTAKLRNDILIQTINQSTGGKLHDRNAEESWVLLEDIALYDNGSWNDPRDFAKPVKVISLPQDVPSTSNPHLIKLENQVQRLMEAHLASMQPTQVNKITSSCEICSGPHDTQYCMENPKQAFVDMHPREPKRRESSLEEQNRNPSSPKHVYFVNLIVILNKEDKAKEEGNVKTSTTDYEDHEMTMDIEEEFEEETEEEVEEEEEEDSPKHFDTFPTMKELRGQKVFVGNFTYECDFMVLEDTTSVIDHDLGSVVFEKPFIEATGLVYDREEGKITFEKDKEKIVFKMPYKMEMFKHIDFTDIKPDRIPPFVIESDDDNNRKTHYSDSLDLGPEYKHDENVCRAIRSIFDEKKAWKFLGRLAIKRFLEDDLTSIKSHLLEDKRIPSEGVFDEMSFLAIGWHLEEIHVTWAHLEKKQTRLRTYTKSLEDLCIQHVETAS